MNFEWREISDSVMELESLTISQPEALDKIVDITVNFGKSVNGFSSIRIAPGAFQGLKSDRVRLHLVFKKGRDASKVKLPTHCSGLFDGSTSVYSIDFNGVDTSLVADMSYMFRGCQNITKLDLRNFDTKNVLISDMAGMFSQCNRLSKLYVSSFTKEQKDYLKNSFEEEVKNKVRLLDPIVAEIAVKGTSGKTSTEVVSSSSTSTIIASENNEKLNLDTQTTLGKKEHPTTGTTEETEEREGIQYMTEEQAARNPKLRDFIPVIQQVQEEPQEINRINSTKQVIKIRPINNPQPATVEM